MKKNILIFGSGKITLNYMLHKIIDKFDIVVRFASQYNVIKKFPNFYGAKTDAFVLNPSSYGYTDECFEEISTHKNNNKTLLLLRTGTHLLKKENKKIDSLFKNEEIIKIEQAYTNKEKDPTSGFNIITYFLNNYKNDNIYIHGFDFAQTNRIKEASHCSNFIGNNRINGYNKNHDLEYEAQIIRLLIEEEKIKPLVYEYF